MNKKIKKLIVVFTFVASFLLAFSQASADNFPNQLDFSSSTPNVPFFRWNLGTGFSGTSHSFEIYVSSSDACYFELSLWQSNQNDYSNLVKVKDIWSQPNRPYLNRFSGLLATSTDINWQSDKYYLLGMKGFNYPDWLSLGGDCGDASRTIAFKGTGSSSNVFDYAYMVQQGFYEINFTPYLNLGVVPPSVPENLGQYKSDILIAVDEGAKTTESIISFTGLLNDGNGLVVKMQVELRKFNEPFTGEDDGGILNSDFASSGSVVSITRQNLVDGSYHWRARAIDENNNASDWQEFGAVGNTDFEVKTVPLYTQRESPYPSLEDTRRWAVERYGTGDYGEDCLDNLLGFSSIGSCGCAITSAVMVSRFHDITETRDSLDVNPENINNWLNSNNGYDSHGNVKWLKVSEYTKNNLGLVRLIYDGPVNSQDTAILSAYVQSLKPVILYNKDIGHFLISDGELAETYTVRDPYFYNTRYLTQVVSDQYMHNYANHFDGLRLFSPAIAGIDGISFNLGSPAELLVTDPLGRKLGKDPVTGVEYNEIPGGSYGREGISSKNEGEEPEPPAHESKTIWIPSPGDGEYSIDVIGTGEGNYALDSLVYATNSEPHSESLNGHTQNNLVADYNLNFTPNEPENIIIEPEDQTAPTTTVSLSGERDNYGWFLGSAVVSFLAIDNEGGVGVFQTEYSYDGSNWRVYSSPLNLGNGIYRIYYHSEDFVSNVEETKSIVVKVKKIEPMELYNNGGHE